jgi:hypothetical protein
LLGTSLFFLVISNPLICNGIAFHNSCLCSNVSSVIQMK